MTRAFFIRHGQSTANIGEPTKDFASVPLTDLGQKQARDLADAWKFTPSLIVLSPFLRTQQTAAPTIARFPDVPVVTWQIHEFTLWDPVHWTDGEPKDLMHEVDRYWSEADAEERHGGGAESFTMLMERANDALRQLEAIDASSPVMVFTHGHFIQALRLAVLHPEWSAQQKMQMFRAFDEARWVKNTEVIPAEFDGTRWTIG